MNSNIIISLSEPSINENDAPSELVQTLIKRQTDPKRKKPCQKWVSNHSKRPLDLNISRWNIHDPYNHPPTLKRFVKDSHCWVNSYSHGLIRCKTLIKFFKFIYMKSDSNETFVVFGNRGFCLGSVSLQKSKFGF